MNTRETIDGSSKHVISDFRRCTEEDFRKNGFNGTIYLDLENMLCPDTESLNGYYKIENGYSNIIKRSSFSIEILTCSPNTKDNCASDEDIEELVTYLFLT